ncbi:hypothetical protein H4W80_002095 [Nonomuraea angiospora]|uniref:Uncharacterized protein n=1 Tax=Nonomuraea angiospora TaxID=46172 RepID=A0ABR9LT63_9ACTN|nr:hypothetical protein [Nonomuraea angiospora]
MSSTLLLPDETEPATQGWEIKERLDHVLDAVIDSGEPRVSDDGGSARNSPLRDR